MIKERKHWKLSEETKRKMSEAHKGKIPWNKGKSWSEEIKKKISQSVKKNPTRYWLGKKRKFTKEWRENLGKALKGKLAREKNPSWKGGITSKNKLIRDSIETRLWREAVFARDNWTCQKCKIKGRYLMAHHIQNFVHFPELRFAIDNGITLCRDCHLKFHSKYGFRNNTEKQMIEFLKN